MTSVHTWQRTTLRKDELAWKTQEGEWRETPHPLLSQHDANVLVDPVKFFWPAGIIRYRFQPKAESFFEFCDYNTDTFVGPFSTMYGAQCAFDKHKENADG